MYYNIELVSNKTELLRQVLFIVDIVFQSVKSETFMTIYNSIVEMKSVSIGFGTFGCEVEMNF